MRMVHCCHSWKPQFQGIKRAYGWSKITDCKRVRDSLAIQTKVTTDSAEKALLRTKPLQSYVNIIATDIDCNSLKNPLGEKVCCQIELSGRVRSCKDCKLI